LFWRVSLSGKGNANWRQCKIKEPLFSFSLSSASGFHLLFFSLQISVCLLLSYVFFFVFWAFSLRLSVCGKNKKETTHF